jgi:hypothetical protein
VARATMKRARKNVRTLIERLDGLGYQFWNGERNTLGPQGVTVARGGEIVTFASSLDLARKAIDMDLSRIPGRAGAHAAQVQQRLAALMGTFQAAHAQSARRRETQIAEKAAIRDHLKDPQVFAPPTADEVNFIRGLEKKGMFLPLAWRAWIEEVGDVNLAGAHPAFSFWEGPKFPGIYADPLMINLDHFSFEIENWERDLDDGEAPGPFGAVFSVDAHMKARLAVGHDQLDEGYELEVPDKAADARFRQGGREVWFVDHLREAFRWGGFPGWASHPNAPAELRHLAEGLLAI